MKINRKFAATVFALVTIAPCFAQAISPVTMNIVVANAPPASPATYALLVYSSMVSGDIVQVNGQPATGMWTNQTLKTVAYADGSAVQNVPVGTSTWTFAIDEADGTPAGVITAVVSGAGTRYTIVSGTNSYLGVTGNAVQTTGNSWIEGGVLQQTMQFTLVLQPIALPTIASTALGPAIVHAADASAVTAAQPAQPGEILTMYAFSLVPVVRRGPGLSPRPLLAGVDVATPVVALKTVNSGALPVGVMIGDVAAEILYAGPYLGGGDGYQINLRMPTTGLSPGFAQVLITSGFMAGASVTLPIGAGN